MTSYEKMMQSYEETHQRPNQTSAKVYEIKNYFSTNIPKKDRTGTKEIRILVYNQEKFEQNGQFWEVFYGHKKQLPDGSWKTFPCLKHEEGKDCPFCEAEQALKATGKESDIKLARKEYAPRKMYILKLVERGKEDEGVKFWRFNHAYDKSGTHDKIMSAIGIAKHNICDIENGRDLIVNITRNQFNTPVVLSVNNALERTPLSDNPELVSEWTNDSRTWRDVYAIKNYDYLDIVVRGYTPVWSKEENKFVAKEKLQPVSPTDTHQDDDDDFTELSMGGDAPVNQVPVTPQAVSQPVQVREIPVVNHTAQISQEEEEDDDLPF